MRRIPPAFLTWSWSLLVLLVVLPLGCSGSSGPGTSTKAAVVTSVASVTAPGPTAPDPSCAFAAELRVMVKPFLAEGRLHRTVRLIEKADKLCPASAPETWADLVTTLAELGRYQEARDIAKAIGNTRNAPVSAKAAAVEAIRICDERDKIFPEDGPEKIRMKNLFYEANTAAARSDSTLQQEAKEKYLDAWRTWRPNGQALLSAGMIAKKQGNLAEAQRLFDRAIVEGEKAQGKKVTLDVPNGFGGTVNAVSWYTVEKKSRLAVAHGKVISIFDTNWRKLVRLQGHTDEVISVAASPDGKTLASVSLDGGGILWDMTTAKSLRTFAGQGTAVRYSPDGKALAVASSEGNVCLWDIETGRERRSASGHEGIASSIAYAPNGHEVVSGGYDGTIRIWNVATVQQVNDFKGWCWRAMVPPDSAEAPCLASSAKDLKQYERDVETVRSVAYSRDGDTIASASNDGSVRIWRGGKELRVLLGHTGPVFAVAYSPDGKTLVSGSADKTLRLWDASNGRFIRMFAGHSASITSVAYSPDGTMLASGSADEAVRIWNVATGKEITELGKHSHPIYRVAFSPRGNALVSTSDDERLRIWEFSAGKGPRSIEGHTARATSVAYSPTATTLASSSEDGTVRLWDAGTGNEIKTLGPGNDKAWIVMYSPDRATLLSTSGRDIVQFWSLATGELLRSYHVPAPGTDSLAYSPDGKTLASAAWSSVRLWDVTTGNTIRNLNGHKGWVESVAYSPNSAVLASGSADRTVRLWDVATGHEFLTLGGHEESIRSVAFSPDGKLLASGSFDKTVRLWDVTAGKELLKFREHSDGVTSVAYSPDGALLASGGLDGILVHRVQDGKLLLTLEALRTNDAFYSVTPSGHIDFAGKSACTARSYPVCRIGTLAWPFDVCEERFVVPGLLAKIHSGDTSYLEPENAPALMVCPTAAP